MTPVHSRDGGQKNPNLTLINNNPELVIPERFWRQHWPDWGGSEEVLSAELGKILALPLSPDLSLAEALHHLQHADQLQ